MNNYNSKGFRKATQWMKGRLKMRDTRASLFSGAVEETLNNLLDAETDQLRNAACYERSDARRDTRACYYARGLHTKAGEVKRSDITLKNRKPLSKRTRPPLRYLMDL